MSFLGSSPYQMNSPFMGGGSYGGYGGSFGGMNPLYGNGMMNNQG